MEKSKTVGTVLREAREAKGLSVEQLHEKTRILVQYIQLLEEDRYDFLPEPYVRGFVRSLAGVLELDAEPLLEEIHRFLHPQLETPEESKEETPEQTESKQGRELRKPSRRPRRTGDYVLAVLFVALIAGIVWVYARYKERWFGPGAEHVKEIPLEAALADTASSITGTKNAADAAKTTAAETLSPIALTLQATDSSWVRVIVDDSLTFEYLFGPGNHRTLRGYQKFYIKTGNAGGLVLKLNGKDVGPVGLPGQVVELWINRDGEVKKRGGRVPHRVNAGATQP